jgi:hypothetical protein
MTGESLPVEKIPDARSSVMDSALQMANPGFHGHQRRVRIGHGNGLTTGNAWLQHAGHPRHNTSEVNVLFRVGVNKVGC